MLFSALSQQEKDLFQLEFCSVFEQKRKEFPSLEISFVKDQKGKIYYTR